MTVARTNKNLLHTVESLFPNRSHYQAQLHITFWSLSLYDIYVPKDRYDEEIKKIQGNEISMKFRGNNIFVGQIVEEGKDMSSSDLKKKREKLMATLEKLR